MGTAKRLPILAKVYIALVVVAGASMVVLIPGEPRVPRDTTSLITLGVAMVLAAVCQVWKVEGTTAKTSYNLALVIFGFTLVVLGPLPAIIVASFATIVDWVWHRYPWYIQIFNIFCLAVNLAASGALYVLIVGDGNPVSARGAVGVLVSAACFVFLNHLMVGLAVRLARKESFKESGVLARLSLLIDIGLFAIGSATALLWLVNPYASLLMLIPLYMFSVTLKVPSLERQATTDSKTGLYNARYFQEALDREISRANRFDRPLSVVIGDLDLLRNINNTYGHLAGDQVLVGIAQIMKEQFRDYDVVARIGGEEFSILMPETVLARAARRVEQLRQRIEAARFDVPTSVEPIRVTMSFGVAERSVPDQKAKPLVHSADLALYRAKLEGRNLVRLASSDDHDDLAAPGAGGGLIAGMAQSGLAESVEATVSVSRAQQAIVTDQDSCCDLNPGVRTATTSAPSPPPGEAESSRLQAAQEGGDAGRADTSNNSPTWRVSAFIMLIASCALAGFGATVLLLGMSLPSRWYDLAIFAAMALLAESLAIDIYVRDTSVSTSGAPFLAGCLLFGPVGALVLSVVTAGSAMVKHRSSLNRFVFNASVHLLVGLAAVWATTLAIRASAEASPLRALGLSTACALVLYGVTTWSVATVRSIQGGTSVVSTWRENYRWLMPYYLGVGMVTCGFLIGYQHAGYVGALVVMAPLFILHYAQAQYISHTKGMVNSLRANNALLEQHAAEISQLNEDLLVLVSNITDLQDPFMNKHCQHVSRYAELIARELGLDEATVDNIRKAGLLHDVGKLGIKYDILWKPGRLTESEYKEVKRHAPMGKEILDSCGSLRSIATIICHHHEDYSGTGYPDGLRGKSIPLESRILRVADTVEAIASDRSYRSASSVDAILAELEAGAGTQFDAAVVAALKTAVEREGKQIIMNSAEEVKVRTQRPVHAVYSEAASHGVLQAKTGAA